jgi:hypothetical protein
MIRIGWSIALFLSLLGLGAGCGDSGSSAEKAEPLPQGVPKKIAHPFAMPPTPPPLLRK